MISTSRGLSAVRPSDDPDADAAGLWRSGQRRTVTVGGETVLAYHAGPAGRAPRSGGVHAVGALQLPVDVADDADGSDSTATTSALAV
jgi:hypothetical protein